MKKKTLILLAVILSLTCNPFHSNAMTNATIPITDSSSANSLILRLNEIKTMDKSDLSSSDKKVLRKEVKLIRHELRERHYGIYISVGAAIVIVILLLILL